MSFWITVLAVVLVIAWIILPRLGWIAPQEAVRRLRDGAVLMDVRSPAEFSGTTVRGALNVPLGSIAEAVDRKSWPSEQAILVYCASGARSGMAVRQLKALGYTEVHNLGTVSRARQAAEAAGA